MDLVVSKIISNFYRIKEYLAITSDLYRKTSQIRWVKIAEKGKFDKSKSSLEEQQFNSFKKLQTLFKQIMSFSLQLGQETFLSTVD